MERDRFAVFILTHGRPDNVITFRTLKRQGYTGDIYIIVDNEDATIDEYRKRYGERVIVFDKAEIAKTFDEGDNFQDRRAVIYARNASFKIAEGLGLDYFLELDDDYTDFRYKYDADLTYCVGKMRYVRGLDRLFASVLRYYQSIPALTVALGQNGEFIGGKRCALASMVTLKRKAMNTFFCSTKRPFSFFGRVNEDVNTYVTLGNRGELFFTILQATIQQPQTQSSTGGMSELYLDQGTYIKSFYTVMYAPSCTKIAEIGYIHRRIHHRINWDSAVPCIVAETYRKVATNAD